MKRGLYLALALLAGALLAQLVLVDPGYVAIRFAGHLVEMSVAVLVGLLIVGYAAVRLLLKLFSARRLWQQFHEQRRQERARRALGRGVLELAEGNWQASEETLVRSVQYAELPVAHLLVAARAADLQGAGRRRDELLARALEASIERRAPVLILQAELHLRHGQRAAAREVLEQLDASGESSARGLSLLARIYQQQGEEQKLAGLEPRLRKLVASSPVAQRAAVSIYVHRVRGAANAGDLAAHWKGIPKTLTASPELVTAYARTAIGLGEHDAAAAELIQAVQQSWDESLVLLLGEVRPSSPLKTLERIEQWLPARPDSAGLLLSCGRLSIQAELYGKARSYLETSLAVQPQLESYQLFAELLEQLGEHERALKICMTALAHAVGGRRALPRLRTHRWLAPRRGEVRRT